MVENNTLFPFYHNSPIFLAVLQIRYINTKLKRVEDLYECKNQVVKIFPYSHKHILNELKIDTLIEGHTKVTLQNSKVDCYLYSSKDRLREFTISLDKFNYKQSGSYSNFDDFTADIKKLWSIHQNLLKDVIISGLSLRFFNRFEISSEFNNPSDFFNVSIQAAEGIVPDSVSSFSIRYVSKNLDLLKHSIVSISLEQSIGDKFPFILDIDVHDDEQFFNDLDLIWEKFESLRIEKNKIFNNILTEKTKSLII